MNGYIYKIWNDINDKVYIGKTAYSLEQRWKEHRNDYKTRRCEKRPLYDAMNKHGIEHFYIELIEECPLQELAEREVYWIGYYHAYTEGYNATRGGDGKFIYDYDYIVEQYKKGLMCYQIAEELGCDGTVVANALKKAGIEPHENAHSSYKKVVKGVFPDGTEKTFESVAKAAQWLYDNDYTNATNIKGIGANVARVAKGTQHRKSYLGIKWSYVDK